MSFQEFRDRARRSSSDVPSKAFLVPVWQDALLDTETPVAAFAKLREEPFAFLLESAPAGGETWARYTFMGTSPRAAWKLKDGIVQDWIPGQGWHNDRRPSDPLTDLESLLCDAEPVDLPDIGEFWSGAVGYFGYDVARIIEKLPAPPARGVDVPDALFVFTNALVIFDNLRSQVRVVATARVQSNASDADLQRSYDDCIATITATMNRLRGPSVLGPLELNTSAAAAEGTSSYDKDKFLADVERVRQYIIAGDAFQVQVARRIDVPFDFSSTDLYRALRVINPSPYMFHLEFPEARVTGASPETLVRLSDGRVEVRPIAGTRPRGTSTADDERLAAELFADPKERAEHLMLIDLGRNDVGRVAATGSVKVVEHMVIERYSHVMHMTSHVTGELAPGKTWLDVLRAAFPAGTLSGAPKIRAMEIIDELEPHQRGIYGGAVGYISYTGNLDLAIAIRTLVSTGDTIYVQAGAGLVADSVPELEYQECVNKARAVLRAVAMARTAEVTP
jgi:anthranilate synthase component I